MIVALSAHMALLSVLPGQTLQESMSSTEWFRTPSVSKHGQRTSTGCWLCCLPWIEPFRPEGCVYPGTYNARTHLLEPLRKEMGSLPRRLDLVISDILGTSELAHPRLSHSPEAVFRAKLTRQNLYFLRRALLLAQTIRSSYT